MMKLYGPVLSPNVFRPLLAAKHFGVEVELAAVDLRQGEHKSPDYRAINPFGRIPALSDGEFSLFESVAISQYLASTRPGPAWPEDIRVRARISSWMSWGIAHLARGVVLVQFNRLVKPMLGMGDPDPAEIATGEAIVAQEMGIVEEWLGGGRSWLVGAEPTLADLDVAGHFLHQDRIGLSFGPAATDWLARVKAMPAWGAAAAHL